MRRWALRLAVALAMLALPASAAAGTWTIEPTNAPNTLLEGVSCRPGGFCIAVGLTSGSNGPATFAERRQGGTWQAETTVNPSTFNGLLSVSCPSRLACFAVGATDLPPLPLAEARHGGTLQVEPSDVPQDASSSGLSGVSCPSSSACVAVGSFVRGQSLPFAEVRSGGAWHVQELPATVAPGIDTFLNAVSCPTGSFCMAVGQTVPLGQGGSPIAERLAGGAWQLQSLPAPAGATDTTLRGVDCAGPRDCIAVGRYTTADGNTRAFAERWDGTTWSLSPVAQPPDVGTLSDLQGVSCPTRHTCMAVGSYAPAGGDEVSLAERWDANRGWTLEQVPAPPAATRSSLASVSCTSPHACIAVGFAGNDALAERYTG